MFPKYLGHLESSGSVKGGSEISEKAKIRFDMEEQDYGIDLNEPDAVEHPEHKHPDKKLSVDFQIPPVRYFSPEPADGMYYTDNIFGEETVPPEEPLKEVEVNRFVNKVYEVGDAVKDAVVTTFNTLEEGVGKATKNVADYVSSVFSKEQPSQA